MIEVILLFILVCIVNLILFFLLSVLGILIWSEGLIFRFIDIDFSWNIIFGGVISFKFILFLKKSIFLKVGVSN